MNESVIVPKAKPDYGIDAPAVLRNLFLAGILCVIAGFIIPSVIHMGRVEFEIKPMLFWVGGFLLVESFLYLLYVKVGKFHHRNFILSLYPWKGDEQVLDVGCGRGLLLIGAAKRLNAGGLATGIDIWSAEDLSGNSQAATEKNIAIEGVTSRCSLVSKSAAEMPFEDAVFDVAVSNLCLHNIYDRNLRRAAIEHIARVLKPGGIALLSDYKCTGEYARTLRELGFAATKRRRGMWTTFPPLTVVVARKP